MLLSFGATGPLRLFCFIAYLVYPLFNYVHFLVCQTEEILHRYFLPIVDFLFPCHVIIQMNHTPTASRTGGTPLCARTCVGSRATSLVLGDGILF